MAFFKKKNKFGTSSRISEFRSPYLKKTEIPKKRFFKTKKNKPEKKLASVFTPNKRSNKPVRWKRILIALSILLAMVGVIYAAFFSHWFDLKQWQIEEDNIVLEQDDPIQQLLEPYRNQNLLFLKEADIINKIKTDYPEVQKVTIQKILPKKVKVELETYPIIANLFNKVQGVQKKFLIDSNGFLRQENIENPDLPYISMATNDALSVRTIGLSQDKLKYIMDGIKQLQEKFNIKTTEAQYLSREREVHFKTDRNFAIWLDLSKTVEEQFEKLKKAQSKLDLYNTPLEYIDLRISGTDNEKVIFKRRK